MDYFCSYDVSNSVCLFIGIHKSASPLSIRPDLVQKLNWLPLASLIVYLYGNNIGLGPLPWLMNGEIFSEEAKGGFISS